MGSESWSVWVKYSKSMKHTLQVAKQQALEELGYATEDEALEATEADGTASPIDIFSGFSSEPELGACWNLSEAELEEHFGSARPTRAQVEETVDALIERLERGESMCVLAYAKGKPAEVLFAGWSFD